MNQAELLALKWLDGGLSVEEEAALAAAVEDPSQAAVVFGLWELEGSLRGALWQTDIAEATVELLQRAAGDRAAERVSTQPSPSDAGGAQPVRSS